MQNYKKQAAIAGVELIKPGMIVGLGAGNTIAHLAGSLAQNASLAKSITLVTSSKDTLLLLQELDLKTTTTHSLEQIDLYFDGCDQLDKDLNALKSGAGIHTDEKIIATMAKEFVLIGDESKLVDALNTTYPLVVEIAPEALGSVVFFTRNSFPGVVPKLRMNEGQAVHTSRNNLLLELYFIALPELTRLNAVKMLAGVIDHSLFYGIAKRAIIAGPAGLRTLTRSS